MKALNNCTEEERYLYHALRSQVKERGCAFDRLGLAFYIQQLFDRLPLSARREILSSDGRIERVLVKRVEDIYRKMKEYSQNKCYA